MTKQRQTQKLHSGRFCQHDYQASYIRSTPPNSLSAGSNLQQDESLNLHPMVVRISARILQTPWKLTICLGTLHWSMTVTSSHYYHYGFVNWNRNSNSVSQHKHSPCKVTPLASTHYFYQHPGQFHLLVQSARLSDLPAILMRAAPVI